jgi:hypothetical protein
LGGSVGFSLGRKSAQATANKRLTEKLTLATALCLESGDCGVASGHVISIQRISGKNKILLSETYFVITNSVVTTLNKMSFP